jgi:hypothetical protein
MVEEWAAQVCRKDCHESPRRSFELGDWRIALSLIGGFDEDKFDRPKIVCWARSEWVSHHHDLCRPLNNKARKYGNLRAPYLIVVADAKDSVWTQRDIFEALVGGLYGTPAILLGKVSDEYSHTWINGFWGRYGAPHNSDVSGVVLLPNLRRWYDRRCQPLIAYNPWATYRLPDSLLPLTSLTYITKSDEIRIEQGLSLADILQLPTN